MTIDEAVEVVYTDACVAALHAMREGDSDRALKWHDLAFHIEDRYPSRVQAIRDRMRVPLTSPKCPRPVNTAPEGKTAADCIRDGECGCELSPRQGEDAA